MLAKTVFYTVGNAFFWNSVQASGRNDFLTLRKNSKKQKLKYVLD
jgi:hypothetical protein